MIELSEIDIPKRVKVIGVPISVVNPKTAIKFVEKNIGKIRGTYICASNAHTTVIAHENKDYLKVQSESIMSLPDGKPLSVIGKRKGYKEMDKTTGTHFMQDVFLSKELSKYNHYFYGNTSENLELMIKNIKKDYPNLNICGYEPSIFRELTNDDVFDLIKRVNNAKADFVWVGIGAPRQEKLMYRLKGKTNSIMVGVGGAFNIFAGIVDDAPMLLQKLGLEWFYRFIKEPRRLFKRYAITNTKFVIYSMVDRNDKCK